MFFCEILALCVSWITYDHLYLIDIKYIERERIEQSRKKVFIKESMSKYTKNVVFIYFASLIIK